jgi:hypothetical protein
MDEDFQWGAYLEQAFSMVRAQVEQPQQVQAQRRSAVSRGYYALHNIARAYATDFLSFKQEAAIHDKAHWQLISLMIKSGNVQEKEMGQMLDELRELRNQADYDAAGFSVSNAKIESLLLRASRSITALDALRKRRETAKR